MNEAAMTFGEDPWRFKCPQCDSVDITKRVLTSGPSHKGGSTAAGVYYCNGCNASHASLTDAKTGERASP